MAGEQQTADEAGGVSLTDADRRRALDAVMLLVEPGEPVGFGPRALRCVRHLIDCDAAAVNDIDPNSRAAAFRVGPGGLPNPRGG